MVELNGSLYQRCPRSIYIESLDARGLINVYTECRNTGTYPSKGAFLDQTAYMADAFDYLDVLFQKQKLKNQPKAKPAK